MKAKRVAVAVLLLLGVFLIVVAYSVVLTASVEKDAPIFQSGDGPLSERTVIENAIAGDEVRIVECVDTKSDRYLVVQTSTGAVGNLYPLDNKVSASVSFGDASLPPPFSPGKLIGCLLWLAN